MSALPRPPKGSGPSGRKLWTDLHAKYEFEVHETAVVVEMVRAVDRLDALHALVEAEGLMVAGQGLTTRVHPALAEARQQAVTLARLSAALRLPAGEEGDGQERRPQRRSGVRGVYGIRGGAA